MERLKSTGYPYRVAESSAVPYSFLTAMEVATEDHMSDTAFGFLLAAELSALLWTALLMAAFSVF